MNGEQRTPIELGVLKSFEFVSQLRRASVIVRNFGSAGCDVYVKGAPECMKDICKSESCKFLVGNDRIQSLTYIQFPVITKIF